MIRNSTSPGLKLPILLLSGGLGMLVYALCFYPGYISHDAAFQYWQFRHDELYSMSPVLLTLIWSVTDRLIEGPGGLFLLFQFLYWGGLVFVLSGIRQLSVPRSVIILLLTGLWPFNLMILPHLWKDVAMVICLLFSVALLIRLRQGSARKHWLLVLLIISALMAGLFRVDGFLPAFILVGYGFWLVLGAAQDTFPASPHIIDKKVSETKTVFRARVRIGLSAVLLAVSCVVLGMLGKSGLERLAGATQQKLFPSVALWDVAHVSNRLGHNLLPDYTFVDEPMSMESLNDSVVSWSNVPIFVAGVRSGLYLPFDDREYSEIKQLWWDLLTEHSADYMAHRLAVFLELVRWRDDEDKPQSVYRDWQTIGFRDNPEFSVNQGAMNQLANRLVTASLDSVLHRPWLYLLMGLLLLVFLLTRPRAEHKQVILVMLLSAISHAFTMFIIAPSAEQRYLLWLINASLLALLLTATLRPERENG